MWRQHSYIRTCLNGFVFHNNHNSSSGAVVKMFDVQTSYLLHFFIFVPTVVEQKKKSSGLVQAVAEADFQHRGAWFFLLPISTHFFTFFSLFLSYFSFDFNGSLGSRGARAPLAPPVNPPLGPSPAAMGKGEKFTWVDLSPRAEPVQ